MGTKISGATAAAAVTDATQFAANIGGVSSRPTGAQIKTYLGIVARLISSGDAVTGANTTPVDIPGCTFDYVAGASYFIEFCGLLNSAAAGTGCGIQMNLSVQTDSVMGVGFIHQLANTGTVTGGSSIADDASVGVSTGVPTGGTSCPVFGLGFLTTVSDAGTVQFRYRSELSAVTTLKAGFQIMVTRTA